MLHFTLYTLNGPKFDDEAYEVTIPTTSGEIGVLPGHMPLISVASRGAIMVRRKAGDRDEAREIFAISGGTVQVEGDNLKVLVDEADHADEINEQEVKAAFELARKMKAEAKDQVSLEHAQNLIDRHAVRLHVASLKRRRK